MTQLQTFNITLARGFFGGTFFRSLEPGQNSNNIVVLLQDVVFYVVNTNQKMVDGLIIYSLSLPWDHKLVFTASSGVYTVDLYIYNTATQVFALDSTLVSETKDLVTTDYGTFKITASCEYAHLMEMYEISASTAVDELGAPIPGYDIAGLRSYLNDNSVIIRMPERGTDPLDLTPAETALTDFEPSNLSGGAGYPANALSVDTGPILKLIHIGSAEDKNAIQVYLNKLLVWQNNSWVDFTG